MDLRIIVNILVVLMYQCLQAAVIKDLQLADSVDDGDSLTDCSVDGKIIPNGQNFTFSKTGPCITYRCSYRAFIPIDIRCAYGNKCVEVGQSVETEPCIFQQCQRKGRSLGYTIISEGCYYKGRCLKINETAPVEGCTHRRCEKRDVMVGLYTVQTGCKFEDGCLITGQLEIQHCQLLTCEIQIANGVSALFLRKKAAMCEDHNGACHSNGAAMQIVNQNSSDLIDCKCIVDSDMNIGYDCSINQQ